MDFQTKENCKEIVTKKVTSEKRKRAYYIMIDWPQTGNNGLWWIMRIKILDNQTRYEDMDVAGGFKIFVFFWRYRVLKLPFLST